MTSFKKALQAHSITITFQSGFLAKILDTDIGGQSREKVDVTHQNSPNAYKENDPNFWAEVEDGSVTIQHDADLSPPIQAEAETITVTEPLYPGKTTPASWACTGFMTSYKPTRKLGDVITAEVQFSFSGEPTITASS